jgi:hypothetical protein
VFTALIFFIFSAHAADLGNQTCNLSGKIVLSAPLKIFCMKDLKIADGTRIITQGYPVEITSIGDIHFGETSSEHSGLQIISFKAPAPQSHAGGPIYIYGHTLSGTLEISNFGASEKDLSGEIAIECLAHAKGFRQSFRVAPETRVDLIVNGYPVDSSKAIVKTRENVPAVVHPAVKKRRKKYVPPTYRRSRTYRRPPPVVLTPRPDSSWSVFD